MRFGEGDFYPRGKKRRMWYGKLSQREKGRETEREMERGREGESAAIGPRRKIKRVKNRIKSYYKRDQFAWEQLSVLDSWTSYGDEIMM